MTDLKSEEGGSVSSSSYLHFGDAVSFFAESSLSSCGFISTLGYVCFIIVIVCV